MSPSQLCYGQPCPGCRPHLAPGGSLGWGQQGPARLWLSCQDASQLRSWYEADGRLPRSQKPASLLLSCGLNGRWQRFRAWDHLTYVLCHASAMPCREEARPVWQESPASQRASTPVMWRVSTTVTFKMSLHRAPYPQATTQRSRGKSCAVTRP